MGLTDTAWATRAGIRKETLSRLRRRQSCDLRTLHALALAVGVQVGVLGSARDVTADGHFPVSVDRAYEDDLVQLSHSGDLNPSRWSAAGPRFFMAGLAVALASAREPERRRLLALAEHLHPGASEVPVFQQWLKRTPLRPTRFFALFDAPAGHAPVSRVQGSIELATRIVTDLERRAGGKGGVRRGK